MKIKSTNPSISKKKNMGKLYIRNLNPSIKENDLVELFGPPNTLEKRALSICQRTIRQGSLRGVRSCLLQNMSVTS